jgi:long-chain acyl-CoA synthetase
MTEEEVIEFCRQIPGSLKVPRYVEFLDDIPRTNMKKVDRKALREMEAARRSN